MAISNCLFSPTSENPRGFSIRFLFAKLRAKPRNKPYTNTMMYNSPKSELKLLHLVTLDSRTLRNVHHRSAMSNCIRCNALGK